VSPRRRRVRRKQSEPITIPQVLNLMVGPPWSEFEDEQDAREVWLENRAELRATLDHITFWFEERKGERDAE